MSDQPAPSQDSSPSYSTLLTNIFTSPSEAFTALAAAPVKHSRWVFALLAVVGLVILSVYLISSNPTFHQQVMDAQAAGMQKAVEEGRMTQDQADRAVEQMSGGSMFLIFGTIFGSIFVAIYFLLGALFVWLAAKVVLKSQAGYAKHLEVYGLSTWIGVLGGIITLIVMLALDSMYASLSAGLAVYSNFDPTNKMHTLLKSIDVFAAWQAVTIGIGMAIVAGKETSKGIMVSVGLWVVWIGISVGLGLAR